MPPSRILSLVLLLTVFLFAGGQASAQDRIFSGEHDGVSVRIFLPEGVEVYRGLILHVANYRMSTGNRWTELARELEFGHVVMSMDMRRNNRPRTLRRALEEVLPRLAEQSGHPELKHIPLAGTGHSAGGMAMNVLSQMPARMLTSAIDCSWVGNSQQMAEVKAVPMLFTLGAIPDGFNMLPAIEERFEPARKDGFLFGLGLEWGKAHDFGNAGTLFAQWIKSVAKLRLPERTEKDRPGALKPMKQEDGWLGDRGNWNTTFANVAPWKDFEGDRSQAVWLPDRATAYVWRAYQVRNAPIQLAARTADGSARLGDFAVRQSFQMVANVGSDIELSITVAKQDADEAAVEIKKLQFFNGDQLIGERTEAPWTITWTKPAAGSHAVFAVYETAEGKMGSTNPALMVIRKPTKVQEMQ